MTTEPFEPLADVGKAQEAMTAVAFEAAGVWPPELCEQWGAITGLDVRGSIVDGCLFLYTLHKTGAVTLGPTALRVMGQLGVMGGATPLGCRLSTVGKDGTLDAIAAAARRDRGEQGPHPDPQDDPAPDPRFAPPEPEDLDE